MLLFKLGTRGYVVLHPSSFSQEKCTCMEYAYILRDRFIQIVWKNRKQFRITYIWLKNKIEIYVKCQGMVTLPLENASTPFKQFNHLVFLLYHFVLQGENCFILLYPAGIANSETSIISSLLYYLFPSPGDGLPSNQWFFLNLLPCSISE